MKLSNKKQKKTSFGKRHGETDDLNASFDTSNMTDAETSTQNNRRQKYNSQSGFDEVNSLDPIATDRSLDDDVLLNMSPKKFEKPKDQLFLDFFSMYTQGFIDEESKKHDDKSQKRQSD